MKNASKKMAFKEVLLIALACCVAGCTAQGGLPLTYPSRELRGTNVSCAPEDQLQAVRGSINNEVRTLIEDTVLPQISTTVPGNCSCLFGGTRVANLDMRDFSQQCPSNWTQRNFPRRTCWRGTNINSCDITTYPTNGIQYNRVCGRIVAYQCGQPEGLLSSTALSPSQRYVDGITITHGTLSPQHVWTYAAVTTTGALGGSSCPCSGSGNIPSFVGSNYFCDAIQSINPGSCTISGGGFLTSRPLWNGGCNPGNACCGFNDNTPWFCTELPAPTSDDIVVSLCGNGISGGAEDTPIEQIEIFVS